MRSRKQNRSQEENGLFTNGGAAALVGEEMPDAADASPREYTLPDQEAAATMQWFSGRIGSDRFSCRCEELKNA